MDKLRFYKYATWGLLLLNIFILIFFIVIVGPPGKGGHGRGGARGLLKMDSAQNESFEASVVRHEKRLDGLSKQQKAMLESYFLRVVSNDSNINVDSIEQKIAALEVQKMRSAYKHFEEVQSNLNNEQAEHFDTFIRDVLKRVLSPSKRNRH